MILCLAEGQRCGHHVTFSKTKNFVASALALAALGDIACVSVALRTSTRLQRANSRSRAEVRGSPLIPTRIHEKGPALDATEIALHAIPRRQVVALPGGLNPVCAATATSSCLDDATNDQDDVADDRYSKRVRADIGNVHKRRQDGEPDQRHRKPECPIRRRVLFWSLWDPPSMTATSYRADHDKEVPRVPDSKARQVTGADCEIRLP